MEPADLMLEGKDFDAGAVSPDVRRLAIYTLRKADFARLEGLERLNLTALELRWCSAPDLEQIPLPPGLQELGIWHSSRLKSCDGIEQARGLRLLHWWDTGTLEDASALARLPDLRDLRLAGGMNQKQAVASLEFLRDLKLETLLLDGIRPHDLDVAPLLAMSGLKRIGLLGADWDIESLATLAARFPAVHRDVTHPQGYQPGLGMRCNKCGGVQVMLRLRKRKFLWCPDCDAKGLARVLGEFDAMVEAARQSGVTPLPDVTIFKE